MDKESLVHELIIKQTLHFDSNTNRLEVKKLRGSDNNIVPYMIDRTGI